VWGVLVSRNKYQKKKNHDRNAVVFIQFVVETG
jgi:hypothetical protein